MSACEFTLPYGFQRSYEIKNKTIDNFKVMACISKENSLVKNLYSMHIEQLYVWPITLISQFANAVELQWLERFWNDENMFETDLVQATECYTLRQVRRHNKDIFSIFFNVKACCAFSLESPRGDSNEHIQYTIFNIKRKAP